ncbi:MAG: sulfite exporter TauE/SafE family protein [Proteobacteria bacterium]|nr:sulfite exporter TauE/SafE family protein [Pseudomonadota bacterium]
MSADLLLFCAAAAVSGACVGILAGMLGIGGGLVLVPVLFELMRRLGVDEGTAVLTAVGTSLASVVATGLRSALSHRRRGSLDRSLVLAWAPAIVAGSLVGAEFATRIDPSSLIRAFAIVTVFLALNMAFGRSSWRLGEQPPSRPWRYAGGGTVGFIAALLGLGVAGLGVPLMTLFNAPARHAVAAAALLGALAALPACIRFAIAGWDLPVLAPWSLGYVNLLGFVLIAPVAILLTPVGVAWSHRVSQTILKRIFAGFLTINAVRMLLM